jgi:hypothetical protein
MLEDRFAQHDKEVVDKYHDPQVSYQMAVWDYVMRPSATPLTGPITVTLPPVAEAKGRFYSIICRDADAINTVTIADRDDSECWLGDIVFDGKCDRALMYSDGLAWMPCIGGPSDWPGVETTTPPGTNTATTLAPTTAAPQQFI